MGLHQPVSAFLAGVSSRALQDSFFAQFLDEHGINFTWEEMRNDPEKLNLFSSHYNGSLAYGNRMKSVARGHYGEVS